MDNIEIYKHFLVFIFSKYRPILETDFFKVILWRKDSYKHVSKASFQRYRVLQLL